MAHAPALNFPVVAISRAGWTRDAIDEADLIDASPHDDLTEWQGMDIYDVSGRRFRVKIARRQWPHSVVGLWLCRLFQNSIHVGFEFEQPVEASLDELRARLEQTGEWPGPEFEQAGSLAELITLLAS